MFLNYLTGLLAFLPYIQNSFGPSNFIRLPDKLSTYFNFSSLLPFLNNEVIHQEFERYRNNIRKLNAFVVIEWDDDNILYPRQTELFDQLSGGSTNEIIKRDFNSNFHGPNVNHESKFKKIIPI